MTLVRLTILLLVEDVIVVEGGAKLLGGLAYYADSDRLGSE